MRSGWVFVSRDRRGGSSSYSISPAAGGVQSDQNNDVQKSKSIDDVQRRAAPLPHAACVVVVFILPRPAARAAGLLLLLLRPFLRICALAPLPAETILSSPSRAKWGSAAHHLLLLPRRPPAFMPSRQQPPPWPRAQSSAPAPPPPRSLQSPRLASPVRNGSLCVSRRRCRQETDGSDISRCAASAADNQRTWSSCLRVSFRISRKSARVSGAPAEICRGGSRPSSVGARQRSDHA